MAKRAASVKRVRQPLTPTRTLLIASGSSLQELHSAEITPEAIGLKAYGLSCIPAIWTKPLFVVSGAASIDSSVIEQALRKLGMDAGGRLLIRSSGVDESLETRGSLISFESEPKEIADRILEKIAQLQDKELSDIDRIHWVVQTLIPTIAKGHLSNERRVSHDLRDWVAEVEASAGHPSEAHRIAIRTWRDARPREAGALVCPYRVNYIDRLEDVARWTYERQIRVHFEWVWDGNTVYVVQADSGDEVRAGIDPKTLVQLSSSSIAKINLEAFREASTDDYASYPKLANAGMYQRLGYEITTFYVLDDPGEIESILKKGVCSGKLLRDIENLVQRPLVIRTDGKEIPSDSRQMLPRSDELRSVENAVRWIVEIFRRDIRKASLSDRKLCLIAHHFVPANASAWCQAHPDRRRVRIESLWGIPEGLYWCAHDVFDVDTLISSPVVDKELPGKFRIREKLRYKERFIAPDSNGAWVFHNTAAGPDWQRSIQRTDWIEEIAWTTRRIAAETGKAVVVMWLIDIPKTISTHRVLPWYHEEWRHEGPAFKAAPRKKFSTSTEFVLRTKSDWNNLQELISRGTHVARVVVSPDEPELVRDQEFAKSLADLAKKGQFIVELSGGILSHAYYMLASSGCTVECVDLDEYATEDDEVEFNKLVRDKIPDNIIARGENVAVYRLHGEALIAALRRKLIEEAFEVIDAQNTLQIAEELADLREVEVAIMSRLGISDQSIEAIRKKKTAKRGAFEHALMLSSTALSPSLSAGGDAKDSLTSIPQRIEKTISLVEKLPSPVEEIHVDKRQNSKGILERQFTVVLPAYAEGFLPPRTIFSLNTQDGKAHEMTLEVVLEREGVELRCRLRLVNTPTQLELPLTKEK